MKVRTESSLLSSTRDALPRRRSAVGPLLIGVVLLALSVSCSADASDSKSIADALVNIGWSPLLLLWAWTQGEPAVIVGGALAAKGFWPWYAFWVVAAVPSAIGHQIYYFIGRRFGAKLVRRLPSRWQSAIERARVLLLMHNDKILLFMRFAYGLRGPLPVVCGAAGIPPGKFLLYNVGTAFAWALVFTLVGYAFGFAAMACFEHIAHYGSWFFISSLVFGLVVHLLAQHLVKRSLLKA